MYLRNFWCPWFSYSLAVEVIISSEWIWKSEFSVGWCVRSHKETSRGDYDVTFFSDVIRRHVTFQTFFFDVIIRHHSFVSRTIQYLHRCLKTKDPLCREQYNIYIDVWKQKTLCSEAKLLPYWPFSTTVAVTSRIRRNLFVIFDQSAMSLRRLKVFNQSINNSWICSSWTLKGVHWFTCSILWLCL